MKDLEKHHRMVQDQQRLVELDKQAKRQARMEERQRRLDAEAKQRELKDKKADTYIASLDKSK
jgi:hypothetical protein